MRRKKCFRCPLNPHPRLFLLASIGLMSGIQNAIDITKVLDKVGSLIPHHGGAIQPVLMVRESSGVSVKINGTSTLIMQDRSSMIASQN